MPALTKDQARELAGPEGLLTFENLRQLLVDDMPPVLPAGFFF